jgi:pyrimidine-specific ribonucleoside hydrolase
MGLYARELSLFSGKVEKVISSAGQHPPMSCFNDGLQVSTGATLGNGRIMLGPGPFSVRAHFTFSHHSVTLALQPSLNRQLLRKIEKIKSTSSGSDYWHAIEQLSMIFWLQWNRKSIFTIEKIET